MNRRTPHFDDQVEIVQSEQDDGWEPAPAPRRRLRLVPAFLVMLVAAGFGGALWYAYGGVGGTSDGAVIPIVSADATPMKIRPDRPGGMEVPHQDKLVFSRLAPGAAAEPEVEQILPPPETPMAKPEPEPVAEPAPEIAAEPEPEPNEPPPAAADAPAAPADTPEPVAVATDAPPPSLPELDKPLLPEPSAPAVTPPPSTEPAPAAQQPVAPQEPAAVAGGYRVQLASVRDEAGALAEINRLKSKHPDELSDLGLAAVRADLGEKGIFFRVQGGPVDAIRAAAICDSLKAQGVACLIVKP